MLQPGFEQTTSSLTGGRTNWATVTKYQHTKWSGKKVETWQNLGKKRYINGDCPPPTKNCGGRKYQYWLYDSTLQVRIGQKWIRFAFAFTELF